MAVGTPVQAEDIARSFATAWYTVDRARLVELCDPELHWRISCPLATWEGDVDFLVNLAELWFGQFERIVDVEVEAKRFAEVVELSLDFTLQRDGQACRYAERMFLGVTDGRVTSLAGAATDAMPLGGGSA